MIKVIKKISFLAALVVLSGCVTTGPTYFTYDSEVPLVYTNDNTELTLTLIPSEELISQLGKSGNVFAEYPALLMKKRTYTFRLDIKAVNVPLEIDLRNIILTVDDVSAQSRYRNQILDDWSSYIKRYADKERAVELTDKYMFGNKIKVAAGESTSGLILFLKNFPKEGNETITIGITRGQDDLQIIELPLSSSSSN